MPNPEILPQRPTYTAEQSAAIAARDFSVALSAGAGCGKTFVLTE
jgi:ATP-dependent helicase/nuclease subunit A